MANRGTVASMDSGLRQLARRRTAVTLTLAAAMATLYFGFLILVAYGRGTAAEIFGSSISVGIVAGAAVIVAAPLLVWIYVRWANRSYDQSAAAVAALTSKRSTTEEQSG